MGKFVFHCLALSALASQGSSFSTPSTAVRSQGVAVSLSSNHDQELKGATRADFLRTSASIVSAATSLSLMPVEPVFARGRATLEQAYDRYSERIISGGEFYKNQMKTMVAKEDWAGIKAALQEPPKKTKADNAKIDGGIQERAAQAGQFSDARVLTALDLLAAQFSDNSISAKTKTMKKDVEEIRGVITEMSSICRQALGEESAKGGLFGVGKKQSSKKELSNRMKELYIIGGTAWNRYAFEANAGIPKTVKQLPFL